MTPPDKLATMANQIARAFQSQGEGAALATADHLKAFWHPRMRRDFVLAAGSGAIGLSPIAAQAVALLTAGAADAAAGDPTEGDPAQAEIDNSKETMPR